MAFLRLNDYYKQIQDVQLQQLTTSNDVQRLYTEDAAVAEAKSYLSQKYDTDFLFKDTEVFSMADTYNAGQLVELNGSAYNSATIYTGVGTDIVVNAQKVYVLKTSGATGVFDATKWTLLGNQYDLYYIPFPYEVFNYKTYYPLNQLIFWKNKNYKSRSASFSQSHETELQSFRTDNIPFINYFPDGTNNSQWGTGTSYSFSGLRVNAVYTDFSAWSSLTTYSAGQRAYLGTTIYKSLVNGNLNVSPDSDITKWQPESWTYGDNRNQQIVQRCVDIVLYHLHSRIAPRNIPELRVKRYDDAIQWLKDCATGNVTLDAPVKQPNQGNRFRGGSEVKRINYW